jgi:hypothetical protein
MTTVVRPVATAMSEACISLSVFESNAEVASSKITIGGSFNKVLAIAILKK